MKHIKLFATTSEYNEARQNLVLPNVSLCEDNLTMVYYNPYQEHDYSQDYFTTVLLSGGTIEFSGSSATNKLSYSTDGGENWTTMTAQTQSIAFNKGDKVLWKGSATPVTNNGIGRFTSASTANFDVEGNAMSLLFGDNFKGQTSLSGKKHPFSRLFIVNTKVVSAENLSLPATTLANYCYRQMFSGCTGLTTAPELPATTLAEGCYNDMFAGCTSLTEAPELPATTLATSCYKGMFFGCTSLETAPELHATTLAFECYMSMFESCGSLTEAPDLPATTLAEECYARMFYGCSSLTEAPELPATTLVQSCYGEMFVNCSSLNSITCLATNISAMDYTFNWVSGVANTGTFTKPQGTDWSAKTGASGIPSGWSVVNK